ncbi:phytanoyl-CoA dioxygenase family protein [Sphingomonas pruni]|uniref:phytanoyl-CoA dioxygenase family protein n=1 Tax=Sphingomonas pruni TaxID=40683 RepID=UPI00083512A0|nr:phytanoyl-CoA dioxygenase family protein [Sphingomonas pruni]
MVESTAPFDQIRGLRGLWALATRLDSPGEARPVPIRTLLDMLGLGLEQTMSMLGRERPDWPTFLAWIEATVGAPDPARLARYTAWYDGAEPPAEERARQAAVMAVPPVFDADDLARWDRDGVVVLREAITRDEAAAIADHLWSILAADPGDPSTWYGPRTNGIMIQHFQHPAMEVPRRSERMAKGFAELYGHADLIVSTDRLSFNPPIGSGFTFPGPHLHWDGNLTPPIAFETQAILYLTDTAADQGALQVVPGFHHRLADGWIASLNGADPRTVDLSAEAVTVPAGAGDLVIWRHEIPHGASANRSDRPRLAQYVNHYPMHWPDQRRWL